MMSTELNKSIDKIQIQEGEKKRKTENHQENSIDKSLNTKHKLFTIALSLFPLYQHVQSSV